MRFWLLTDDVIATTSALWTESRTTTNRVQVKNGLFSIMLGSVTPLADLDFNQTLYLGVEIGGADITPNWDGEMSPRKVLGAVPAAFTASTLNGHSDQAFLRSDATSTASELITFSSGLLSTASSSFSDITFETATATTLVLNNQAFTDFLGFGLFNNSGALSVSTSSLGFQPFIVGAASSIVQSLLTSDRVLISDGAGQVATSTITTTELSYLSSASGNIQTQLNNKISSQWTTTDTDIFFNTGKVGIGTSSPSTRLSVFDTSASAQLALSYDALRVTTLHTDSAGNLTLSPSGKNAFFNDDNLFVCTGGACPLGSPVGTGNLLIENRLGVGTTSPRATLTVFGDTLFEGDNRYLNFGQDLGTTGYGFRDNGGTIEFKHEGGTWTALAPAYTPNQPSTFTFDPKVNQATSTLIESDEVTIIGFQGALAIIATSSNATAQVYANGEWATSSVILPGQAVKLRVLSSAYSGHTSDATLYVGASASTFNVDTLFTCGEDYYDARDGQTYGTIEQGTQCWMTENMNIGTRISGSTNQTDNGVIEKYCYSDNDANCTDNYPNKPSGGLYQWNEAMQYSTTEGAQGICPSGWHVPSDYEWYVLENYLDPTVNDPSANGWRGADIGTKLKPNGASTMEMNLGGYVFSGSSNDRGGSGGWWSSSVDGGGGAWRRSLYSGDLGARRNAVGQDDGFSVRCLRDV